MPHLTRTDRAAVRQALKAQGDTEAQIKRALEDLDPPVCKADGKPLCESCWRGGKGCVGEITIQLDFTKRKTWRSAEAAAYGWID